MIINSPLSERKPAASLNRGNSIGIMMSEALRAYDEVRKRPLDLIDRLQEAMLNRIFPDRQLGVRGNIVAADVLLDAFIHYGTTSLELFVHPESKAEAARYLEAVFDRSELEKVSLTSIDSLVHGKINDNLAAWFNPLQASNSMGGMESSSRIRASCGSRMYPITFLIHGLGVNRLLFDPFLRLLMEGSYPCDSMICTSRACREAMRRIFDHLEESFGREFGAHLRYNGRLDLIPLGVDTDKLRPQEKGKLRRQLKLPNDAFILLFLGRISSFKADLYPFALVFEALLRRNPGRKLLWLISGSDDKDYTKRLLEYCRALGIDEHVKVMLNLSDVAKENLIPAADVFISPTDTLQESFGLTPVEAMACGIPQVLPDWSGYRDTVAHGETGFLVPTYWTNCHRDLTASGGLLWAQDLLSTSQSIAIDLGKYTESIQALIGNEALRHEMGQRSRQRALTFYSLPSVVRQYEELWAELAEIARRLPMPPGSAKFDRPAYFDLYGHFASNSLSEDTTLRLTAIGEKMAQTGAYWPPSPGTLSDFRILDESLLRRMLDTLASDSDPGSGAPSTRRSPFRMNSFVELFAQELPPQSDYIRRHCMWLIKYGCLEVVSGA